MKQRKIPMRTCIITKEKCEKSNLVRVVRTPSGDVEIDLKGKANGRGAYLKKDLEVFKKAEQSGVLEKVLEVKIPNNIYEELKKLV